MIDIKQAVKEAFEFASEEESNSEKALNLIATKKDGVVTVDFYVDGDDYGMHSNNYVKFKNGRVIVSFCEMLESSSLDKIMVERLKGISVDDINPDCFKTIKEQIYDILNYGIGHDDAGYITGIPEAADKIANLFN